MRRKKNRCLTQTDMYFPLDYSVGTLSLSLPRPYPATHIIFNFPMRKVERAEGGGVKRVSGICNEYLRSNSLLGVGAVGVLVTIF